MIAAAVVASASGDISGDEARSQLRRELLDPDYQEESLLQRALTWIQELAEALLSTAQSLSTPSVIAVIVVIFALCILLLLSLSRVRASSSVAKRGAVLVLDPTLSAAELLHQALTEQARGEIRASAVSAFRSAAARQVEQGALSPAPGATARDIARSLGERDETLGREFSRAADVFEVALYSELPIPAADSDLMLSLARGERVPAWNGSLPMQVPR